jgi:hypothetical protein
LPPGPIVRSLRELVGNLGFGLAQDGARLPLALRLPQHERAQMIADREALGRELQRILDEKTNPRGNARSAAEPRGAPPRVESAR